MNPFLITGLPRSRTAWLAVAACTDQSVCWHEPVAWLNQWQDVFTEIWGDTSHRYVGVSDSALGFHLREILERASPRVLIVDRDIHEVERSLARLGPIPGNYCSLLCTALEYAHPLIMRVPFQDLVAPDVVARCLQHLMPGVATNLPRLMAMRHMNIQTDMRRVRAIVAKRSGDGAAMLGADVVARLVA